MEIPYLVTKKLEPPLHSMDNGHPNFERFQVFKIREIKKKYEDGVILNPFWPFVRPRGVRIF